jgi:hypothetical protein
LKHEGKRLLGSSRYSWEDDIKIELQEILWESVGWIHLAQDMDRCWAVLNMLMGSMNDREFID